MDTLIPALTLTGLAFVLAGVMLGFVLGAMPGLDITTGVALLLPLTYTMAAEHALVFFSAVYCAGVFGGSITAILFNVPGTSESVMTAVEGHPFTKRGEPGLALGTAIVSSGLAGILASLVLILVAPLLASVALRFGPSDYAALGVLGLACVSAAVGRQVLKGVAAALLGLFLGTVGIDRISSTPRFVLFDGLAGGIDFVAAIIGLFAVAEVLRNLVLRHTPDQSDGLALGRLGYPSLAELFALRFAMARSWLVGLLLGIVPGVGASSSAFIAHGIQSRFSKAPEKFGSGALDGVAAPEAANNAAAVGALIPLLSLGIPGSSTAAVILGAFAIHNLQPGPLLFIQQPDLVGTILWAVLFANIAFVVMAFFVVRWLAQLARLPYPFLGVAILTISVTGALAIGGLTALGVMLAFAALGVLMLLLSVPIVPLILGLVLGPIIEVSLRRAMLMSGDEVWPLLTRPLTAGLILTAIVVLLAPTISAVILNRRS
ncbi:MAG: tripartite tricarboxylate transporter permease [Pseudomonadota bacterium]